MARGQQKIQSQQKKQKEMEKKKKAMGHDQKASAAKALVHTCAVCKVCVLYIGTLQSRRLMYCNIGFMLNFCKMDTVVKALLYT